MRKLVFISPTVSPPQVRFAASLRKYYDAEFYFLDDLTERRISYSENAWKNELRDNCHVVPGCRRVLGRWFSWHILEILRKNQPEILMLGGFSDWAVMVAYVWGRVRGCKIVVQTERSRDMTTGKLRTYGLAWRFLHWFYRKVNMVMTVGEDIVPQFRDTFRFGDVVVAGHYPYIIDSYFSHPTREGKKSFTLLHANRLVEAYNPLASVRIFAKVLEKHPETRMKMNAAGAMRPKVEALIHELGLEDKVSFLDGIRGWDDLDDIYRSCDIMILPAVFSNGNYTIVECAVSGMAIFLTDKVMGSRENREKAQPGCVLPLDESIFAEKVCDVIEHPKLFTRYMNHSREVWYHLTNDAVAARYHELFERLY